MDETTWTLEDMKQTLNLLKKALITEREDRKQAKSELLKLLPMASIAEKELKDKVIFYSDSYNRKE